MAPELTTSRAAVKMLTNDERRVTDRQTDRQTVGQTRHSTQRFLVVEFSVVTFIPFFEILQLARPPGTLVPKAFCFTRDVFFFFRRATSELRRPIAVKLCHMIAIWVNFIMQVQTFGGPAPQRNWGPKTCKILRDFRQLQNSIANISETGQDIQNRKTYFSRSILPAFDEKSPMNFGPLTTENWMCIFRDTIFRPLGGAGPSNFNTH